MPRLEIVYDFVRVLHRNSDEKGIKLDVDRHINEFWRNMAELISRLAG
jgi:hypothetical protein